MLIARLLWSPSGTVMRIVKKPDEPPDEFRQFIETLIAEGGDLYPDDPPPLVEWDET